MGKKRQPRYMDHYLYRIDMKSFLIHVSRHCQTQVKLRAGERRQNWGHGLSDR